MIQNPQTPPDKIISGETFSEPYRPGPSIITNPEILAVSTPFQIGPGQGCPLLRASNEHSSYRARSASKKGTWPHFLRAFQVPFHPLRGRPVILKCAHQSPVGVLPYEALAALLPGARLRLPFHAGPTRAF